MSGTATRTIPRVAPPTRAVAQEARVAGRALARLAKGRASRVFLHPEEASRGDLVALPRPAIPLLVEILTQLASGNSVAVVAVHPEITTQQAAELLNVSRPYLVGLLDRKAIPSRKVGVRRRIRLADLLLFKQREQAERKKVLDDLAAEAQALGLGY